LGERLSIKPLFSPKGFDSTQRPHVRKAGRKSILRIARIALSRTVTSGFAQEAHVKRIVLMLFLAVVAPVFAKAEAVSFKGKQITMVIGFAPGGGTDLAGRVIAKFLGKYLPGQPNVVVVNQPGADGISALNLMVMQTKPDGLHVAMGSSSQVDPLNFRAAKAVYDPSKFFYIGGVGRGRSFIIINSNAERRLYGKTASPVTMGSVGVPRSGMQVAAWGVEYLGWNIKWIVGYHGTGDVILALKRGEIDMTSVDLTQATKLMEEGSFKLLNEAGNLHSEQPVSAEIDSVPIFKRQLEDKITDPIALEAFKYWASLNSVDKWLALMPGTPPNIVSAYRKAFDKAVADPDFVKAGKASSDDFSPINHRTTERIVRILAATSPKAIGYTSSLLRKQGIDVTN
jgi:tripartite-type tricarboxylate transporter receptor subunit TctC